MSTYQRYFFKSLMIFIASLAFLIIFLLESNFGFKLFFNITNYFFYGFKIEEISGNWRDFTLKNTAFNFPEISIKATHIHILIDPISLFKMNKIFKKIETKNLIFSFHKSNLFSLIPENFNINVLEKNFFFIRNNIILKKIYSDKIFLKSKNINIYLSNVNSSATLINNNFTILDTYIHSILLNLKQKNQQNFFNKTTLINKKKINSFFALFLDYKKFLLPKNINFISVKCKQIKFLNKKFKNILFKGRINKKIIFQLKFNDFLKFNLYGRILLNNLKHPIYMNLYVHRLLFPIKKDLMFTLRKINLILNGTVNNYNLSFKNIISITGMPSFMLNILGDGNLNNISLNKVRCIQLIKHCKNNTFINSKKKSYLPYIYKLIGNINISNSLNKKTNSINFSHFNIKANIINKKLLMLGSLYYNQNNNIEIPRINFFFGKNKGFISGTIFKNININSSINANNLDYFIPNLKGAITSTLNIYGLYFSPIISSFILGEKLNWNNLIYLNQMKMFINMNCQKKNIKNIFLNIKKIKFFKFYLDFLKLNIHWNDTNQRIYLFLKNKYLNINFIINGQFDHQTGIWKGIFKKINVLTFNKKWIIKKHPIIFFYKNNIKIRKINAIQNKNFIFSTIYKLKKKIFSSILNSSVNFKTNLFFKIKFLSDIKKNISNIKIFLHSRNIKLQKKINNQNFIKKIFFLKIYMNFIKNNCITHWIIYPFKNNNSKFSGFLNIYDIFYKKNISGKYFLLNFPSSILNFFIPNFKISQGTLNGDIKISKTFYQPNILADIHLKNVYITSNHILSYIVLFFEPSLKFMKYIKINQSILIKKGDILFKLYFNSKDNIFDPINWNIFLHSNKFIFFISPKIKLSLSSEMNLHYYLFKYDLIGYLKSYLFYFKINEKNFVF